MTSLHDTYLLQSNIRPIMTLFHDTYDKVQDTEHIFETFEEKMGKNEMSDIYNVICHFLCKI